MKVKLELELPEIEVIYKGLKVIDPMNIFLKPLKDKIAEAVQPSDTKEKK